MRPVARPRFAEQFCSDTGPPPDYGVRANSEDTSVDKDRTKGSAEQIKGRTKEVVGRALGDTKLETDGKTDKAVGKMQNTVGGLKDVARGK